MKGILKIVAIASGLVCVASMVVLAYLYLEDATKYLRNARRKIVGRISDRLMGQDALEDQEYFEFD